MREFVTAAKAAYDAANGEEEGLVSVPIRRTFPGTEREDEVRVVKAHRPDDGQLAILLATVSVRSKTTTSVAGIVNFFMSLFDERDQAYLEERLLDRRDEFGIEEVGDILEALVEEWTGNPTDEPSGSTPSQQTGGRKSTRRTPALT